MSLEKLTDRNNGSVIDESWFNKIKKILIGVLAPRNSLGEVEANAGSLGTATYRFNRAYITSGYLRPGMVKMRYNYNGAGLTPSRGWMLCNGNIVNQTNYDSQHGAGAWTADGMSSSPLAGKYLPNLIGRHIQGTNDALQNGSSPISTVGASTLDISHNHGSGTFTSSQSNNQATIGVNLAGDATQTYHKADHTHTVGLTALSQSVNLTPESMLLWPYMRII